MNPISQKYGNDDKNKIIVDSSEYWDYIQSGKSWDESKDGLLHFIISCLYEISKRDLFKSG